MRVKIEGTNIKLERVYEVLADVMRRYPEGATLQFFNMYFNIRDQDGTLVDLVDEKGRAIDILTYRESRNQMLLKEPDKKNDKPIRKLAVVTPFTRPAEKGFKKQSSESPPTSAA